MSNKILNEVKATIDELIQLLSSLSEAELNTRPFENSWTSAQVGEHLLKSYGVAQILEAPVKPTERPADEKIETIKEIMLNFDTKMNAPEFIIPSAESIDKAKLLNSLQRVSSKIQSVAENLDLSETCTGFALPGIGELTRLEWLHFILYHTQRHIRQLKTIRENVIGKVKASG